MIVLILASGLFVVAFLIMLVWQPVTALLGTILFVSGMLVVAGGGLWAIVHGIQTGSLVWCLVGIVVVLLAGTGLWMFFRNR